jgi:uncharacterized protein YcfJ
MKKTVVLAALGVVALGASAQEVGRVISSNPVVQQVAVPQQVCGQAYVQAQPQTSGAGGLLGALTGAGIGSAIGAGTGNGAAILGGAVLGAIAGNSIEANNARAAQAVPTCTTQMTYENRTVGYDVTYEYAGRQFTTRMAQDPGATIALQVTPVSSGPVTAPPVQAAAAAMPAAPIAVAPTTVAVAPPPVVAYPPYPVYAYPAYPVYRPYYPVGISLGFVFGGGHRHWR